MAEEKAKGGAPVERLGSVFDQVPALLAKPKEEKQQKKVSTVVDKMSHKLQSSTQAVSPQHTEMRPISLDNMNWVDWSIVVALLCSLAISIMRGAMRECLSILSWIAGLWLAFHCSTQVSHYLSTWVHQSTAQVAITIALLILFALIMGKLLQWVLSKCIEWGGLSGLDRFIGFWFGLLRGLLIISLLLMLAKTIDLHNTLAWQQSVLIPHFEPVLGWLGQWLPVKVHQAMVWLGVSVDGATVA